ncbi:uncharacterized protein B0P05DRAFT_536310 [Gilbertella persicaria]|uniref:uncharacterized protein n=1 Tax=Gilbertella persicaria TaxID=101096 RepID=UPI00221F5406|nr:uncharacterized protein B0P05DRAFT_536310 [Gilbertella persicaria]KAI8084150.1 hypothetical protein B0P05DRAFT_536310 [Gilbertella persicaria]
MNSVAKYYAQIFGLGLALGGSMEVLLIKSNYYQMLAASEAKQRLKELQQEQEDAERFSRLQSQNQTKSA